VCVKHTVRLEKHTISTQTRRAGVSLDDGKGDFAAC